MKKDKEKIVINCLLLMSILFLLFIIFLYSLIYYCIVTGKVGYDTSCVERIEIPSLEWIK